MKYFFLLIIIITWLGTVFSLSSCEKEPKYIEPQPTDTLYVDPEFKRYWYFPEGSWWVYKRTDTTGEVYDTVTIYYSRREIYFSYDISSKAFEAIKQNLNHSSRYFTVSGKEYVLFDGKILQNLTNESNPMVFTSGGSFGFFSFIYFFHWPIESTNNKYIVDTASIKLPIGKVENVVHFNYRSLAVIWIAKDIGFIKYIHYNSDHKKGTSTWELVNYHINK